MVAGDQHFPHLLTLQTAAYLSQAKEDGCQHPVHGTCSWTVADPTNPRLSPSHPTRKPGDAKRTGSVNLGKCKLDTKTTLVYLNLFKQPSQKTKTNKAKPIPHTNTRIPKQKQTHKQNRRVLNNLRDRSAQPIVLNLIMRQNLHVKLNCYPAKSQPTDTRLTSLSADRIVRLT